MKKQKRKGGGERSNIERKANSTATDAAANLSDAQMRRHSSNNIDKQKRISELVFGWGSVGWRARV